MSGCSTVSTGSSGLIATFLIRFQCSLPSGPHRAILSSSDSHRGGLSTMRLDGKVALISGGARGQGSTEALLFAGEGARVVIGDLLEEAGKQVEAEINASGGTCLFVKLDVTQAEGWQHAAAAALGPLWPPDHA